MITDIRARRRLEEVIAKRGLAALTKPELVERAALLYFLLEDMHHSSTRPCPTCDPVSAVVGQEIGCTAFRRRWARDPNGAPYQNEPAYGTGEGRLR